jgi:hypothetical protein
MQMTWPALLKRANLTPVFSDENLAEIRLLKGL